MDDKKQSQNDVFSEVSPLAQDETYGEKMHDFVFKNAINFWLNLLSSAAFSFWVAHSQKPTKILGNQTPHEWQSKLTSGLENSFLLKGMTDPNLRHKRAHAMSETLTLVTIGHVIMIPSVWLGAKIKPWFVKTLDHMHYGARADNDPSIQLRHAMVEAETRPTIMGAIVGRLGTVAATQLTARLIGSEGNFVQKIGEATKVQGLAKFKGLNPLAGDIGEEMGVLIGKVSPPIERGFNKTFGPEKYSWSQQQQDERGALFTQKKLFPYDRALRDFSKYTAMDVLYTAVTSMTIHPILNLLRFVPGMTYKPKLSPQTQKLLEQNTAITHVKPTPFTERVDLPANDHAINDNDAPAGKSEKPTQHIRVGEIKNMSTVTPRMEKHAAQG